MFSNSPIAFSKHLSYVHTGAFRTVETRHPKFSATGDFIDSSLLKGTMRVHNRILRLFFCQKSWWPLTHECGFFRADAHVLKWVLFVVGLLTLIGLAWHIGPERIVEAGAVLGPSAILMILVPSILMYGLDTLGWRFTLNQHIPSLPFGRLCAVRMAGEMVNMTTPTASVGGEPLKAFLLKSSGVPMEDGLASVVVSKATMTLAQVVYILLGMSLMAWILPSSEWAWSSALPMLGIFVSVGLLLFGVTVFVMIQRYGLFMSLLGLLRKLHIRLPYLEIREQKLLALDRSIQAFYTHNRPAFFRSTAIFFLGWVAEALEVYAILFFLGAPIDLQTALALDALATFIKGGTSFIPGSVGAQEGGNVLLLMTFGFSELTGILFALVRRFREVVWIGIGLICLAAMGWPKAHSTEASIKSH